MFADNPIIGSSCEKQRSHLCSHTNPRRIDPMPPEGPFLEKHPTDQHSSAKVSSHHGIQRPHPLVAALLVLVLASSGEASGPKIAAIQLMPGSTLLQAAQLVAQAGQLEADLVVLPMGFAAPQAATGSVFQTLSPYAMQYDMYVVAPIQELSAGNLYNTALVIGPGGALAHTYRQAHVSPEDRAAGISEGNDLPVFDTLLGKIGVLLGYDLQFREAARVLALRGADLLLYSYHEDSADSVLPAVRLGEAVFYDGYYVAMAGVAELGGPWASAILDLDGRPLAFAGAGSCVVSATTPPLDMAWCEQAFTRELLFACRDPYAVHMLTQEPPAIAPNSQTITVACVRCLDASPPCGLWSHQRAVLTRAGVLGADVVLTQEAYLANPDRLTFEDAVEDTFLSSVRDIAELYHMTIIAGITLGVEDHPDMARSAFIIAGPARELGVHYQHTGCPADDFPLFDTGFGSFGGLVCWDLAVMGPEYARVEALKGASMLFYGTLTICEGIHDFALPSLARQNVVPIAFSAHANLGTIPQVGVVGPDGTYLEGVSDVPDPGGVGDELVLTTTNLALSPELTALKQQLWDDRKPDLYAPLIQSDICLADSGVQLDPMMLVAGQPVTVSATTYNAFEPFDASYNVQFRVDDEIVGTERISYQRWRSPGGRGWDFGYRFLEAQCEWMATAGSHVITIEADADREYAELREDNNVVEIQVEVAPSGVGPDGDSSSSEIPALRLAPNPFSEECGIAIDGVSAQGGHPVTVEIVDVSGRRIWEAACGSRAGGKDDSAPRSAEPEHLWWRPERSLPSGVYFVRASTGARRTTTRQAVYVR
jgi:predicted amidohydrolase